MRKLIIALGALGLCLAMAGVAPASLVNPSFETGDFTGWSVNATTCEVVTSATTQGGTPLTAPDGDFFAVVSPSLGAFNPTIISQTANLTAGEKVVGYALFDGRPYWPYDDRAFVMVNGNIWVGSGLLWSSDNAPVGIWQMWSFTAPSDGSYLFEYGFYNYYGYPAFPSRAFFDTSPVPLPGALVLLVAGMVRLANYRRRKLASCS